MAKITIIKGEEFKISVKEQITSDDLFIAQYGRAAVMLDEIAGASEGKHIKKEFWSWKSQDFENNIIAFCGERGEGKSSAMMTFVNAVYTQPEKNRGIFSECRNLKQVYFAEPVVIDPSLFDDVHNVLDIVLAKIYRNFYNRYNLDNQYTDEWTRERLLDRFQKVYRYVSLINNQKQMLDDEFDYEGNISKLTKMGESTNLKEELAGLIEDYLEFMDEREGNRQLLIAIDDLDLCSANAYKMTEQIRKYLVIPHVCVIISVRIGQLELCIREKNLKDFAESYKSRDGETCLQLEREVQEMARRYVSKLIPASRRIYLPKVQRFKDVQIICKESRNGRVLLDSWNLQAAGQNSGLNFTMAMLDLIYERTGMRFLLQPNGISYLLPNNLRDIISWILMISEMEEPRGRDEVYIQNIEKFEAYFVREQTGAIRLYDGLTLLDISNMDTFRLHVSVQRILKDIYQKINPSYNPQLERYMADRADSFFQVMKWYGMLDKNMADLDKETDIYWLRVMYTIRINKLIRSRKDAETARFFSGYIWGPFFTGVLPSQSETGLDRSRFIAGTVECYNIILKQINPDAVELKEYEYGTAYRIGHLDADEQKEDYIKAWIVVGLFSNVFYYNNGQMVYSSEGRIIFENNIVWEYVQISLENYITGLCNLDALYEKVNMRRLGIKEDEFQNVLGVIKEQNQELIQYAKQMVSNMDLLLGLIDYCIKNRDYKGSTRNATDRSAKLVTVFFNNVAEYMTASGIRMEADKFISFRLSAGETIDCPLLYAKLFDSSGNGQIIMQSEENEDAAELVREFRRKITEIPERWSHEDSRVSLTLRNRTARHVKNNLDNLALRIQRYLGENKKPPKTLDVEGLCTLYGNVVEIYLKNRESEVTAKIYNEYKWLVKVQNEMKTEDEQEYGN